MSCGVAVFAVIGYGPVSPGCLIGIYVVIKRPNCFSKLVDDLYGNQSFLVSTYDLSTAITLYYI